jgi:hypothetical protein
MLAFHHCDKIPEEINLKIYFGSQFERFQSMVTWLCFFWACGEAEHQSGETKLLASWWSGRGGRTKGGRDGGKEKKNLLR